MAALSPAAARSGTARFAGAVRAGLAAIEGFILPQCCPGCGAPAEAPRLLCDACWERVPRLDGPLCVRCLARECDPSACGSHPGFGAWAAHLYDERLACAVKSFKFEGRVGLADVLGEALANALPMDYRPDLVLEVPLHTTRLRERGYNQAARLADVLALRAGAPRWTGALRRVRPTAPQAGLSARDRRRNLDGAFAAVRPEALRGREVLIVDDVLTTGSTLEACLAVLKDCGARASGAALAWAA